ncbi:MAG: helix-turn-helix domain-containing protein [Candidatus Gastranaerophilales bacterium]|nr:helix-turn-helix domain-containing protein [Candidatus Gastranaerophilales bacterium]MCM1073706.1 helix-turn-helix domain-containing protein [Bacteroides sp.]
MNIKQELGEKVKRLRKRRGLTQEQLAELIEISPRNFSNIELGITFPKAETLEKILKALNTSTQELFANDHIKTNEELIEKINIYINTIQNNTTQLELVYKIIRDIIE